MMSSEAYKYILGTVLCAVLGFTVSPWFLLFTAFAAFAAYSELTHEPAPVAKTWRNATEDDDWVALYHEGCESPAETAFLDALIAEYDLKPDNGVLKSPELVIEMQFVCMNYRFDFLANGSHIIEIDGAAWHSSPEQVERDRMRDEASKKAGFEVLRIPAKVVFNTPKEAMRRVREALHISNFEIKQRGKVVEIEQPKSFMQHTNSMLKGFSTAMDEISRHTDHSLRRTKALSAFRSAIEMEGQFLKSAVQIAERKLEINKLLDGMTEDSRMQLRETQKRYEGIVREKISELDKSKLQWPNIPVPGTDSDPEIQKQITLEVGDLNEQRDRRFAELKARGDADKNFQKHLYDAIKEFNCPEQTMDMVIGFWEQVAITRERKKATVVSTLESPQQTD